MGRRGPTKTPTKLLLLRGSRRGQDRAAVASVTGGAPPPKDPPLQPPWVKANPGARSVWEALVPALQRMGLLDQVDAVAMGRYCLLVARWLECEEFITKHGHGFPVYGPPERDADGAVVVGEDGKPVRQLVAVRSYPHVRQAGLLVGQLVVLERELGLTPAARARIATDPADAGGGAQGGDPFFSFG